MKANYIFIVLLALPMILGSSSRVSACTWVDECYQGRWRKCCGDFCSPAWGRYCSTSKSALSKEASSEKITIPEDVLRGLCNNLPK